MAQLNDHDPIDAREPSDDTFDAVDSPRFFRMGPGSRGRPQVSVFKGDRTRVDVQRNVTIERDIEFIPGGMHRIDWVTSYGLREMFELPDAYEGNPSYHGDINVGSSALLGRGSKVLSGVTIGEGAVVLPFSVVVRDVRPYAIVAGNPAREMARRFEDSAIDELMNIDWGSWPIDRVRAEHERITGAPLEPMKPPVLPSWSPSIEENHMPLRNFGTSSRLRHLLARLRLPTRRTRGGEAPPQNLTMGFATYLEPVVHAGPQGTGNVRIGKYSSISPTSEILLDARYRVDEWCSRSTAMEVEAPRGTADVSIGSDVWVCTGAKIFPGVTIGDGAVVAAWGVVMDDVPPYAIVGGSPARQIGRRFDDETVAALLRIQWWDWPHDQVIERWRELCNPDIASFVRRYDPLMTPSEVASGP